MIGWLTVAPLYGRWPIAPDLPEAFTFDDCLRLSRVPAWLRDPSFWAALSPVDKRLLTETEFAWFVRWSGDDNREVDRGWAESVGVPPLSPDFPNKLISLADTAMWLAQPSGATWRVQIDLEVCGPEPTSWQLRRTLQWGPLQLLAHEAYRSTPYRQESLDLAKRLYLSLRDLGSDSIIWPGLRSLRIGLRQEDWPVRFLLIWIALESLFGPMNPGESRYRLAQRAAFFLANDSASAEELAKRLKESYDVRSAIVHGFHRERAWKRAEHEEVMGWLLDVEMLARAAYVAILSDSALKSTFESAEERERFLDRAVFRGPMGFGPSALLLGGADGSNVSDT